MFNYVKNPVSELPITVPQKKTSILMVIDNLACGGKERRLLSLLKGLENYENIQCHLALIDDDIFYPIIENIDVKVYSFNRYIKKDPRIFLQFLKLCKEIKPDIIHSWGSMPSIYAIPAKKILNIKLLNSEVANAPKNVPLQSKIRTKITFPFSDIIMSNSFAGINSYKVPTEKGLCIYNGFDFQRIKNLQSETFIRKFLNIKTQNVVGMVGAIYPKKDYLTFLLSAMEILKDRNDITFLVVGNGEKIDSYKELTKHYSNIIYAGEQKDVESIINIFDVGVLCTNNNIHGEGISNSILEYMALKKPVIATEGGGTVEIVQNELSGFLINSRDPNQLTEKIIYLLNHPEQRRQMGQKGFEIIKDKFSISQMVNKTVKAYESLLGENII